MNIIELQKIGETKNFNKGCALFDEGDEGDCMYIILKGKIAIYIGYNLVKEFEAGDFLGEMSLLENLPRSATAIAVTNTTTLIIDAANVEKFIALSPTIALKMLKGLSQRVSALNQQLYR